MVSKHSGYEGNSQRRWEEVALEQLKVHDNEEKCKVQAYTMVTILGIEGKKIFHSIDQNPKVEYRGQVI